MSDNVDFNSPLSYLSPGQKLGKYEIKALLGRGGVAEVYRAYNPDLNRDVAIKLLQPSQLSEPGAINLLRHEAQAVAALNHPNIIHIYDFHSDNTVFFIVMELIEGPTLSKFIQQHPHGMPVDTAVFIITQILKALDYAHSRDLIHRDVKPSNILLAEGLRPVLMDFGLAQLGDSARLTNSGFASGTPFYLAPELLDGKAVQPSSDLYALGVVFYEMLTGQMPFNGTSYAQIIHQQLNVEPTWPSTHVPNLPADVEGIVMRALEKNPDHRYQSAKQMLVDLERAILDNTDTLRQGSSTVLLSTQTDSASDATARSDSNTLRSTAVLTQTITIMQKNPVLSAGFILAIVLVVGIGVIVYTIGQTQNKAALPASQVAVTVVPSAPDGMVFVPAGVATIGTTKGNPNEAPPHDVTLSDYFIDKTEVTNSKYLAFVLDTLRTPPDGWSKPVSKNWIVDATQGFSAGNPTQRFSYNGQDITPIEGSVHYDVNADTKTGDVITQVTGTLTYQAGVTKTGHWKIVQKSYSSDQPFFQGGIATDVEMHGDSGQEAPFFPKVIGTLATWGTADLYLDDQIVASDLGTHTMYIAGMRDQKQEILKAPNTCCYDPSMPGMGYVDPNSSQVTVLLFTPGMYMPAAPSKDAIWLELNFTNVTVQQKPDAGGGVAFPPKTGNRPVTNVSWLDAAAYCEYVNKRLPTEAEWEHAARGPQNWLFPWGDSAKINGIIPANWTSGDLQDVGSYPAGQSAYGALDMAGNAWEWVNDWYDPKYYANSPKENPTGPSNGLTRVVRGGGYVQLDSVGPTEFTSTFRLDRSPDTTDPSIGFRCAKDVQ